MSPGEQVGIAADREQWTGGMVPSSVGKETAWSGRMWVWPHSPLGRSPVGEAGARPGDPVALVKDPLSAWSHWGKGNYANF